VELIVPFIAFVLLDLKERISLKGELKSEATI